jgi:hypothetical protein
MEHYIIRDREKLEDSQREKKEGRESTKNGERDKGRLIRREGEREFVKILTWKMFFASVLSNFFNLGQFYKYFYGRNLQTARVFVSVKPFQRNLVSTSKATLVEPGTHSLSQTIKSFL